MSELDRKRAALKRRIRRFYELLNHQDFMQCFGIIDPRLLDREGSITYHHYKQSISDFLENAGSLKIIEVRISSLHQNEPTKLYDGRDFALGITYWEDGEGQPHQFKERWVLDDEIWYTRSTGFLWTANPDSENGRPAMHKRTRRIRG